MTSGATSLVRIVWDMTRLYAVPCSTVRIILAKRYHRHSVITAIVKLYKSNKPRLSVEPMTEEKFRSFIFYFSWFLGKYHEEMLPVAFPQVRARTSEGS